VPGRKFSTRASAFVQQALENVPVARRFQVEGDRLLAAVDRCEIGRFAAFERAVLARVVTGLRHLDLDDPRAKLGQQQRAIRPGENARQIDDGDAGKRPSLWHSSFLLVRRPGS
jgi:hypothetical protein